MRRNINQSNLIRYDASDRINRKYFKMTVMLNVEHIKTGKI